ncbi:MAG: M48 family metalloprotease [Planctomycetes bacterium]|nr:M48 family metalloprotease [Planctomycetota bacterium]
MFKSLVIALGLVVGAGCRSAALSEVRSNVDKYHAYLQVTPARAQSPSIDQFLEQIATDVLHASLQLEGSRAIPDERDESNRISFYDGLDLYLVHSPAPNAATPGDDCAEVTTRLFLEVDRPECVVAVVCHEFGHIRAMHQFHEVLRRKQHNGAMFTLAMLGAAAEGYANAQNAAYGQPYNQRHTNWGRLYAEAVRTYKPWDKQDEHEADLIGLELYLQQGFDPAHYLSVYDVLTRFSPAESDTHPSPEARLAVLRERLDSCPPTPPFRELDAGQFQDLQYELAVIVAKLLEADELISNEGVVAALASVSGDSHRVNCCGPTTYDRSEMDAAFVAVWLSRLRRAGPVLNDVTSTEARSRSR